MRVSPCWAVPVIVGGEVFAGAVAVVVLLPPCTEIVSATIPNAWAAVSFPTWRVAVPAVPRLALVDW